MTGPTSEPGPSQAPEPGPGSHAPVHSRSFLRGTDPDGNPGGNCTRECSPVMHKTAHFVQVLSRLKKGRCSCPEANTRRSWIWPPIRDTILQELLLLPRPTPPRRRPPVGEAHLLDPSAVFVEHVDGGWRVSDRRALNPEAGVGGRGSRVTKKWGRVFRATSCGHAR